MSNIQRYQKLGRGFMKKHFEGEISTTSGNEDCLAMVLFPGMTFPTRHWLRWKMFTDPSVTIDPHVSEQWVMSVRAGDIHNTHSDADFDSSGDMTDMMERYLQNDPDQNESVTTVSNRVGITGGEQQSEGGRNKTILDRKYNVGLPNHAMLIDSKKIMFHAVGDNNRSPYLRMPRAANVENDNIIGIGLTREQPLTAGTDEEDSVTGDFNQSPRDIYDKLVEALPAPVGATTEEVISDVDLDGDVFNWLSKGYTIGTYGSTGQDTAIKFQIDWTIEFGIYAPKTTTTLIAP